MTWDRLELNNSARKIVLDACLFFHLKRSEIFSVVIMHDHAHMLIQPWEKSETEYWSISKIMHSIKSFTSKQIPQVMTHIGTIWVPESHDHIIRNEKEFWDAWEYIRQNPVKEGFCATPEEYPYFWQSNYTQNM